MYLDKQECFDDILHSLRLGVLHEKDIRYLLDFYKETENYECCQGVVDAYVEFKKEINGIITD
tara:strand:+ start:106 stop:294 length:189 start_codon:yes stop_codon:yes gene_type:complete